MAGRIPVRRREAEAGFSMIEVLIAIMVLAIVAGGVAAGLTQASTLLGRAKGDAIADKLAAGELETVRRLDYDEVGTAGGNPGGALVADRTETRDGAGFRVQTAVVYVDDPAPGQSQTRVDYKQVRVTVTPLATGGKATTLTSLVAPPTYASIAGKAAIVVTARDPVAGTLFTDTPVTVSGGPGPDRTDATDDAGSVTFAGLTPNSSGSETYDVGIAPPGYVLVNPASDLDENLTAGETFPVDASFVKPVRVDVGLNRSVSPFTPIADAATVTLTSPSGTSGALTGSTGAFSFATLGGSPVLPSSSSDYTLTAVTACAGYYNTPLRVNPSGYPGTLIQAVPLNLFTRGTLTINVRRATDGPVIPGATVTITGGAPAQLGSAGRHPAVVRSTNAAGQVAVCLPASTSTNYTITAAASGYVTTSATGTRTLTDNGSRTITTIQMPAVP